MNGAIVQRPGTLGLTVADIKQRPVDDVRRALAMTWKGEKIPIPTDELVRKWCFDIQWFSVDSAELAISSLIQKGWLEISNQGILPCIDTREITAPLGWWPRTESLTNPPDFAGETSSGKSEVNIVDPHKAASELAPTVETKELSKDPRMKLVPRLVKYVSRKAGLEIEEVNRRMERKMRALGPITPWMCLILIAKEQGLQVDDIVETFV